MLKKYKKIKLVKCHFKVIILPIIVQSAPFLADQMHMTLF